MLNDEYAGPALMTIINIIQLSSIHFGNDKNFHFLISNKKYSLLEFVFKTSVTEDEKREVTKHKIDVLMSHRAKYNGTAEHEWNLVARTLEGNSKKMMTLHFRRLDNSNEQVCCVY